MILGCQQRLSAVGSGHSMLHPQRRCSRLALPNVYRSVRNIGPYRMHVSATQKSDELQVKALSLNLSSPSSTLVLLPATHSLHLFFTLQNIHHAPSTQNQALPLARIAAKVKKLIKTHRQANLSLSKFIYFLSFCRFC